MANLGVQTSRGRTLRPAQSDDLLIEKAYARLGDQLIADLAERVQALLETEAELLGSLHSAEAELSKLKRVLGSAQARLGFTLTDGEALLTQLQAACELLNSGEGMQ